MEKNKLIGIGIVLAIIYLISLSPSQDWFPKGTKFPFLATIPAFEFNGFIFEDSEILEECNSKGVSSLSIGNQLQINVRGDGNGVRRQLKTDVTGIDELLIIYEGYGQAYCSARNPNAAFSASASIIGSKGGSLSTGKSVATSRCTYYDSDSVASPIQPSIWKLKNNFDGTWSILKSIGIGDIFIVDSTEKIYGERQYLVLSANAGTGCGNSGGSNGYLKIYNIVRKESGFAQCKADEYVSGFDAGKPICQNISNIVLNFEESIFESFNEFLQRKEQELMQKSLGLNISIEQLKQQLREQQKITSAERLLLEQKLQNLTLELQQTKKVLNDVQNKEPEIREIFIEKERFIPDKTPEKIPASSLPTAYKIIGGILGVILLFKLFGVL